MKQKATNRRVSDPKTLTFHREMYLRRLRTFSQREGLTESEVEDLANTPTPSPSEQLPISAEKDCPPNDDKSE